MKKIATLILLVIGLTGIVKAQGDYEAYLFSQSDYLGTARFMGAGGAFGTTGGDFSAVSTNPASIGLYKRSEVSITPFSLSFGRSSFVYNGNINQAKRTQYSFPQCGIVLKSTISKDNNWRSWQFGFGYNRIADFNNTFRYSQSANSTIMDQVVDHVNGIHYDNLTGDGYIAWNNWLIDTLPGETNLYYSPYSGNRINQNGLVVRKGAIDEMTFTFGGNYNDKLYIGATIGFPFIDFKEITTHNENPADEPHIQGVSGYTMTSEQRNSGTGINLKVGVIYQPVDFVRIGLGIHTPTYYWRISDDFYRALEANYSNGNTNSDSYTNYNRFSFTAPFKFNVGASFIILKRAFISGEYEYQNYGMANLYADDYDYIVENQNIKDKYGASHNFRVGGEFNITQVLSVRAGYRFKSSPFKLTGTDNNTHYISAGLGLKGKHFFGDLAYVMKMEKNTYWIYDPVGAPGMLNTKAHGIVATIGYKF